MHMIVIGCGRMGAGLAQTLAQRSHVVTVVDSEPCITTGNEPVPDQCQADGCGAIICPLVLCIEITGATCNEGTCEAVIN